MGRLKHCKFTPASKSDVNSDVAIISMAQVYKMQTASTNIFERTARSQEWYYNKMLPVQKSSFEFPYY